MTAPGPSIDPKNAAQLARQTNEYAAHIRDANPSKFGFFAALPCIYSDKEAALKEIRYALDHLKADGVTLFTRYGKGNNYLGAEIFKDVWAELNAREAVVFIHPTHAVDTTLVSPSLPAPMIDYPHETTRTAVDLITSGTVRNNPGCKIILSHAGGTLPYLALRAGVMLPHTPFGKSSGRTAADFIEDARSFYYDLALSGNEYTLGLLTKFAKPDHILFGSDFPYAPRQAIDYFTSGYDDYGLDDKQRLAINQGNALKLFPRLVQSRSAL